MQAHSHSLVPTPTPILRRVRETEDVFSVSINVGETSAEPGQFNMLTVFGAGEIPISISAICKASGETVHTVRNVGGVSQVMAQLRAGDEIGVRGPFGRGWPIDAAIDKNVLIVAGGIGLVPLRPVLQHCLSHAGHFRDIVLLYGARTPEDVLFRDELAVWEQQGRLKVELSVDQCDPTWQGNVGVITPFIARQQIDFDNTVAMVCGPEIMMRFACDELRRQGLAEASLYLSMERNMKCGVGFCGHCQLGPHFVCKGGPVFSLAELSPWIGRAEL